jgi:hypothetical protein
MVGPWCFNIAPNEYLLNDGHRNYIEWGEVQSLMHTKLKGPVIHGFLTRVQHARGWGEMSKFTRVRFHFWATIERVESSIPYFIDLQLMNCFSSQVYIKERFRSVEIFGILCLVFLLPQNFSIFIHFHPLFWATFCVISCLFLYVGPASAVCFLRFVLSHLLSIRYHFYLLYVVWCSD